MWKDSSGVVDMTKFFLGVTGVICSAGVWAYPTSNIVNPIADSLGHREVALGYTISGYDRLRSRYDHSVTGTIGIYDRVELGGDHDFLGSGTWSLKYSLFDDPSWAPGTALAVGVLNISGRHHDRYVVGRKDFDKFRIHAGYGRFGEAHMLVLGADYDAGSIGVLHTDFQSGPEGYLWFAHSYVFGNGWSTQVAFGRPNRGSNGWQHFGFVGYGFSF